MDDNSSMPPSPESEELRARLQKIQKETDNIYARLEKALQHNPHQNSVLAPMLTTLGKTRQTITNLIATPNLELQPNLFKILEALRAQQVIYADAEPLLASLPERWTNLLSTLFCCCFRRVDDDICEDNDYSDSLKRQ